MPLTVLQVGGGSHVKRFDALDGGPPAVGALSSFFAFDGSFTGGVRVAEGDVTGDGVPDYIAGAGPGGVPEIRIIDGAGAPVPDAMVEIWHPDHAGTFLFGRLETDAAGACAFETVFPGQPAPGAREAAHVNLCIFMRGLLRHLYTRLYFAADPLLETDAVLAAVPPDRRGTLIARRDEAIPATWRFDVHLQGDRETVYFDL